MASQIPKPTNPLVTALLTDLYQITMAYAYWKTGRHRDAAVFELFFRKNPFGGEFTIFCGLDECIKHLSHFRFTKSDVAFLQGLPALQHCDSGFWTYLEGLDASEVSVQALPAGTVCFPKVPLIMIEAPLAIGQLLETTLLTLVNYPSLLATNAARMVRAARNVRCVEFGLRRAQGPDGGISASKYCTIGGFVATSNVQAAAVVEGISVAGTHAHAFVQSYTNLSSVEDLAVDGVVLLPKVLEYRKQFGETLHYYETTNDGELAAFVAYASAFPKSFLCLIDTYDTLQSGVLNFLMVATVLDDLGYKAVGVRLDSGDLAYLSTECRRIFDAFPRAFTNGLEIVASNDINEETIYALNEQGHAITTYGIGTNLVTCQRQPALGCVYKLVEINEEPRIKLSQEITKVVIPGRKRAFRLYGKDGCPILDLMVGQDEEIPIAGKPILCRHPFIAHKRALVTPARVESLHATVFDKGTVNQSALEPIHTAQELVRSQLSMLRSDVMRYQNPTPYKVSVTDKVFHFLHDLWQKETPVTELS